MTALYSAALGPVNAPYYLAAFARFDTLGRSTPGWNWPASLCTLAWMVFRQLWGPALMYAAAVQGLAVMAFVLLRTLLDLPAAIEGGLLAALVLLSMVVPGLYGTAMVYADIRKRVDRALAATPTLHEAQTMLAQQASGYKRMSTVALVSALLAGTGAVAYVVWPLHTVVLSPQALDTATSPTVAQVQQARAQALPADPSNAPADVSSTSAAPLVAAIPAVSDAASAPAAPSSNAAAVTQAAKASEPQVAAPTKAQVASAPESTTTAAATLAVASASSKKPVASTTASSQPPTPPANSKPMAASASAPVAAHASPAALEPTPDSSNDKILEPVGQALGYYINVGLFANEANARKAQARLLNEGISAFRQTVDSAKGPRIRVRAGPYATATQANDTARRIRSMGLEAQVFKR
jgi:cell division protein FtsN